MDERHWVEWHRAYEDPDSPLSRRLRIVQARIRETLDRRAGRDTVAISVCAGQGHDLLDVLAESSHRAHVRARLVESDPHNVDAARQAAKRAHLPDVEVVLGDASALAAYDGFVPADLVLLCGVFGNISPADIEHTITCLPQLCARDALVIWTRHRRPPDRTPTIRSWFSEHDFDEVGFDTPDGFVFSVGTHRFAGASQPLKPGVRLFTFVGDGMLPA